MPYGIPCPDPLIILNSYLEGFRGDDLITAFCVQLAESDGYASAIHQNPIEPRKKSSGSVDRGIWQFNSFWHSEVTDAQAFNIRAANRAAYALYVKSKGFSQWNTYQNGAHLPFVQRAHKALADAQSIIGWIQEA